MALQGTTSLASVYKPFSTVSRPQTNGQAESANKIVLKRNQEVFGSCERGMVRRPAGVVWSAQTTTKEATGNSPFGLVYGSEAVLPIEVDIPSPQMNFYEFEKNEEEKPINLDFLSETLGKVLLRSIRYKQRVTRQFNRRVKVRLIQLGDWLVKKVEATTLSHLKGKLGVN